MIQSKERNVTALLSVTFLLYFSLTLCNVRMVYMNADDSKTLDLLMEYLPLALPSNTIAGHQISVNVITREKTCFGELAKKICCILRNTQDCFAYMLGKGFIDKYQNGDLLIMSQRESDHENVDIFELYYLKHLSKNEIMELLGLEDERTFYKKLARSRELFAIAIYDFLMFANK